jgi:hypothetical protein
MSGALDMTYDNISLHDLRGNGDDFPLAARLVNVPGIDGGGETVTVSGISTTPAAFVAAGSGTDADNAAIDVGLYAGGAAGDWIFVFAAIRSSGTGSVDILSGGYTRMEFFPEESNAQVFAKIHDGSEPATVTVTPAGGSAGDTVEGFSFGFRNMPITLADLNDAIVGDPAVTLNSSAQDIAYLGCLPNLIGAVKLLFAWKQDDYTSIAVPTGFTEILEEFTTTGSDQGMYAAYAIQFEPELSPQGTLAVTGGAAAISRAAMVALAGGYQTMTLSARSANGTTKSHDAGTRIEVEHAHVLGL